MLRGTSFPQQQTGLDRDSSHLNVEIVRPEKRAKAAAVECENERNTQTRWPNTCTTHGTTDVARCCDGGIQRVTLLPNCRHKRQLE